MDLVGQNWTWTACGLLIVAFLLFAWILSSVNPTPARAFKRYVCAPMPQSVQNIVRAPQVNADGLMSKGSLLPPVRGPARRCTRRQHRGVLAAIRTLVAQTGRSFLLLAWLAEQGSCASKDGRRGAPTLPASRSTEQLRRRRPPTSEPRGGPSRNP